MAGNSGGTAAAFRRKEPDDFARWAAILRRPRTDSGPALNGLAEIVVERRIQELVSPGPHGGHNRFRLGRGIERHQHALGQGGPNAAHGIFKRQRQPGDIQQYYFGPQRLQPLDQGEPVPEVPLFYDNPYGQAAQRILYGLP